MKKIVLAFLVLIHINSKAQQADSWFADLHAAYEMQDYEACLKLELTILPSLTNRFDSVAFQAYSMLAESWFYQGDFEKALTYFSQESSIREKLNALQSEEYLYCLQNIAELNFLLGKNEDAISQTTKLINEATRQYAKDDEDLSFFHLYQLNLLLKTGNFNTSIPLAERYLQTTNRRSPFYAYIQNKLGEALRLAGYYSRAEQQLKESVSALRKFDVVDSTEYAKTLANLGVLYLNQGRYLEADGAFSEALSILQTSTDQEAYYATLNNQALILSGLSLNEEAIDTYNQILKFDEDTYGTNHPYYSISLSNMALAYNNQHLYEKGAQLFSQSLQIDSLAYGANSYDYGITLNNLARTFRLAGDPKRSIPLLEKSREIFKNEAGEKSPDFASVLNNLGISYSMIKSDKALQAFLQSLAIRKKQLGVVHPKYGESTDWMTRYYWMQNDLKSTKKFFRETFKNYYQQISLFFPFLSENEKAKFYYDKLKPSFERFDNFATMYYTTDKTLLGDMFNNQLNTKALIMYATNKVRDNILRSGDSVLISRFNQYINTKEQLSKLLAQSLNDNEKQIDSLSKISNDLEKELTKKSAAFEKTYSRKLYTWQQVRDKLNKDEAAIEIIRYVEYKPDSAGHFTNNIKYVALLVRKDSKNPELITLEDGNRLESRYINFYRNNIQFKSNDTLSYNFFWKPIQQHLQGVKKVFVSPDGVYNQINLNTLKNGLTNKYVIEEIQIEGVTNTRDLLERTKPKDKGKVYLYGFPIYNTNQSTDKSSESKSVTRGGERGVRSGILRYMRGDGGIALLPGTKREVQLIESLFAKSDMPTSVRLTEEADEYSLKNLQAPYVLHIATHGFFLDNVESSAVDNKYFENPLLRSGLILAGAGDFLLTGDFVKDTEQDGILTSFEAMNLNLDGTELVVLSACETALGSVKNGEGVYGLQRALKIAGANAIVMSLWSVDDDATQELMTLFYERWLESGNKRASFRAAQLKLREKYPNPFYWGAFVMVGE